MDYFFIFLTLFNKKFLFFILSLFAIFSLCHSQLFVKKLVKKIPN